MNVLVCADKNWEDGKMIYEELRSRPNIRQIVTTPQDQLDNIYDAAEGAGIRIDLSEATEIFSYYPHFVMVFSDTRPLDSRLKAIADKAVKRGLCLKVFTHKPKNKE